MKFLINEIKEWKHGWLQYLKYSWKLTVWLYISRWRRLTTFLNKHSGLIRRSLFLVVGLIVALVVNRFSGINFTQDILSNYLIALGAMIGGTIAIVFTISIFLIQSAAELYSSQYFEVFIHDWREKFVYFVVIIITLAFFGGGLYIGSLVAISLLVSSITVIGSLILTGAVFALIDWQYKNVRQKLNPSEAIAFLEKEGVRFLNKLQSDAEKLADILRARNSEITKDMALAQAYNQFLQSFITNLDRQLENLVEISMKLADKQEVATTKRGFTAIYNILARFFEARKTSSLIIPSGIAFLAVASDSQTFLNKNFERLNKAGEKFIKEGKDEVATYIIDVYKALALKAKDINFVSGRNENPVLEQLVGNLDFFIQNGERAKNVEVVFQGARVLTDIAVIAADKGLDAMLRGIQQKLLRIAIFAITEKQGVIIDRCNTSFQTIIGAVFGSSRIARRFHFDDSLKNIATIATYLSNFIKSGLYPNDIGSKFTLSKAYDELYVLIVNIYNHYPEITGVREKDRYRGDFVEFLEELYSSLRNLSEKIKTADNTLTDSIGRLLFNINNLIAVAIENPEYASNKVELLRRLSWNIYLPTWFASHSDKFDAGSNAFNTFVDGIAKIGIIAAQNLGDKKVVSACVESIFSLTKTSLEKNTDSHGYDEPRILEKACYLGILALKKDWDDIFVDVAMKIYEFEPLYAAKYFSNIPAGIDPERLSPKKKQLTIELWKWRHDFDRELMNGMLRIRDDAEAMMYEVIDTYDIDKFIFKVWQTYDVNTKFGQEMELKLAREALIKVLKKLKK